MKEVLEADGINTKALKKERNEELTMKMREFD